ncbi:MAG: hypothetical protein HRU20_14590 [Pseudomonadales bacterium]|nr:hypothetical protein [Pseudomonadales bacterium]
MPQYNGGVVPSAAPQTPQYKEIETHDVGDGLQYQKLGAELNGSGQIVNHGIDKNDPYARSKMTKYLVGRGMPYEQAVQQSTRQMGGNAQAPNLTPEGREYVNVSTSQRGPGHNAYRGSDNAVNLEGQDLGTTYSEGVKIALSKGASYDEASAAAASVHKQ